jgi:hypothetical protein
MKKIIPLLLVSCVTCYGQTIYKSWYAESGTTCLTIDEKGYSTLNELEYVGYKLKNGRLKITIYWSYTRTGTKDIFWYDVEKLTADSLVIKKEKDQRIPEHLPFERMTFIAAPKGCYHNGMIKPD